MCYHASTSGWSRQLEVNSDETMTQGLKDAAKISLQFAANVNAGVITLTGSIKRSNLQTLLWWAWIRLSLK